MPRKVAGRAGITTKGSPKFRQFNTMSRYAGTAANESCAAI
jgi:hypothetical protein